MKKRYFVVYAYEGKGGHGFGNMVVKTDDNAFEELLNGITDAILREHPEFKKASVLNIQAIEDAPAATWTMVDEDAGTGVCSHCNRQDHIDPLAAFCRYCGTAISK